MKRIIKINEQLLGKIVRNSIDKIINGIFESEHAEEKTYVGQDPEMDEFLRTMDSSMNAQDEPKVGIFWFSPRYNTTFGEVAIPTSTALNDDQNSLRVTCKQLHKNIWAKKYNKALYHGGEENKYFVGDYKDTPRGRVWYDREMDEYIVTVGDWIDKYPQAKEQIKYDFDLNNKNIVVKFEKKIHWQIGMGYGD